MVTAVLVASKRRCAFCYGLDGDTTDKEGQIAHIDRNSSNVKPDNAAWLCLKHHARYDSSSKQAKGHTPEELRYYQAQLYEYLAFPQAWPDAPVHTRLAKTPGVSLEVFDRRVPVYRATIAFIRTLLKLHCIELKDMFEFAAATDEALFLFDDKVAEYLALLYKRGLRLRAIGLVLEAPERRTPQLTEEQTHLALWFSEQFAAARKRFAPFLRIS